MLGCHVVVSGVGGAGKSTLAAALARALGVGMLSKDRLKEALYRELPASGSAESLQLSAAAMDVLYDTARRSGGGLVLDANWRADIDGPRLDGLPLPLVQIVCRVPPEVAQERVRTRVRTGERHPVHRDVIEPAVLQRTLEQAAEPFLPVPMSGPTLEVDTSGDVDVEALANQIQRLTPQAGGWNDEAHVATYLARVDRLAPRRAGEEALVEALPPRPERVLDLGCGDGRLAALVINARPSVREVVAVDISPPMLARARERFRGDKRVEVRDHDLDTPLEDLGPFDVVVSGCAIHHLEHPRKRELFAEVKRALWPGGGSLFANLEVVQSATPELHAAFLAAIGRDADDPEDRLAAVEPQLAWMRDAGLAHVDCLWRWRGLALLAGRAP
jgi:SAM-dependent methyltransferase/predicted kinase